MVVALGSIGIALVVTHTDGGMLNGVIGAISGLAGIQAGAAITRGNNFKDQLKQHYNKSDDTKN